MKLPGPPHLPDRQPGDGWTWAKSITELPPRRRVAAFRAARLRVVSRQFWGFVADRIGSPRTILAGSACQITAMIGFLLTRNEAGLFAVAAWFGLGFSGIIPVYVLAVRELFPASEASWRVPTGTRRPGTRAAARR